MRKIDFVTRGATPVSHAHGPLRMPGAPAVLTSARAASKAGAENFPVALRALPARYRRHLMAVYNFARAVDDVGDEPPAGADPRDPALAARRLELLDEFDADVARLYDGGSPRLEVVGQLAATVAECSVPRELLRDLIAANRQDQLVSRYPVFDDLLGYCALSANPVGRIVLYVFGAYSPHRAWLSDRVCTALQLAEHWQDVAEDLRAGRIYLPLEDLDAFGCDPRALAEPSAGPAVRTLMAFEVRRASALLSAGSPLVATLRGAARVAVAGYVAGGRAALAAIAAARYDVLAGPPRPDRRVLAAQFARTYVRGR
jgi:squalene synthase HpnC